MPENTASRPALLRQPLALLAMVITAVLAIAGVVAIVSPAQADPGLTGVIDGTVYLPDEVTPVGANEAEVVAHRYDDVTGELVWEGQTITDASGLWSFASLPIGEYAFQIMPGIPGANIVGGFPGGEYTIGEVLDSHAFELIVEDETRTIDYSLATGGIISGRVTGALGVPLPDAVPHIYFYSVDEYGHMGMHEMGETVLDSNGDYEFIGLPERSFTIQFVAPTGYVSEYWNNKYVAGPDQADAIDLESGEVFVADAQLGLPTRIAGTVKNSKAQALANIDVTAYQLDPDFGWMQVGTGDLTLANGTYELFVAPGTYRIGFANHSFPGPTPYLERFYANSGAVETATSVVVGSTARTGINMVLTRSSVISGKVLLAGAPAYATSDVTIDVCNAANQACYEGFGEGNLTYDSGTGNYSVSGLSAGSYNVFVHYTGSENYRDEYYDNKYDPALATKIVVGTAATVINKNVTLDPGATIAGTIRNGGVGVENVTVGAFRWYSGYTDSQASRTAVTDSNGEYVIGGLGDGSYVIRNIEDPDGHASRWYGNSYTEANAKALHLKSTNHPVGIDIDIEYGSTLYGTILGNDNGLPIQGAGINLYRFDVATGSYTEWAMDDFAFTDEFGHYEVYNLAPGRYALQTDSADGYPPQFWMAAPGVRNPAQAGRFDLSAGGSTELSFGIDLGGSYQGRVVDVLGNGVPDVAVHTTDSFAGDFYTDENGEFTISGLREGPHTLRFDASTIDGFTWYSYLPAPATTLNAMPVVLADFELEAGSQIDGVVRNTAGAALANVDIRVFTVNAGGMLEWIGGAESAANGSFSVGGLPTDAIYLEFHAPSTSYPLQYLGGSPIWSLSDPVVFVTPGTAKVEARLVTGGTVTGIVKNKATGRVIPGVVVGVSQTTPGTETLFSYKSGTTNTKGAYVVPGLDAGGYDVSFNDYGTGPGLAFSAAHSKVTVGEKAVVTANATLIPDSKVSGIVRRNATGDPIEGAYITATSATGQVVTEWSTATGAYALSLDVGVWTVHVSDPTHQSAAAYFRTGSITGTPDFATATKITVTGNGAAFAARNVNLPAATGSLTADIMSTLEADPSGSFLLQRMDGATVLSSEEYLVPRNGFPLNTLFPIENVTPGTYRLVINAQSALSDGGVYPEFTTPPFLVDGVSDAGQFDVGTPALVQYDTPTIVPGFEPTITGDASIGGSGLMVDTGVWSRTPGYFFFEWTRNGKPITGAVTQHYDLRPGDAGATIAVNIGASDFNDYHERQFTYTATLGIIAAGMPANLLPDPDSAPAVSGKPFVGQVLTVGTGKWDLPGLTYSYQWFRNAAPIAGATAATYKAVTLDVGATLTVEVSVKRSGFAPASSGQLPVPAVQPAIAMKATVLPKVSTTATGWKVTTGTWTPVSSVAAPITYTYQWREYQPGTGVANVVSAGSNEFEFTSALPTSRVTVVVTASKPGYTPTSIEIPVRTGPKPTFVTNPGADPAQPQVGVPIVVSSFDADPPLIPANPGDSFSTVTYQWYRGATVIAGATKQTYVPTTLDVGKILTVKIALKATGYAPQVAADAFPIIWDDPVAAVTPLGNVTSPEIVGDVAVGRLLKATNGTWSATPTSFTYKWKRDGVAISKATLATYTPVAADLGKTLTVEVTPKLGTVIHAPWTSAGQVVVTQPVTNVTPPTIPVTARVGVKLVAAVGKWDLAPTSYLYQWTANGEPITAATTSSYTPVVGDLDEEISVTVIARRTGFPDSVPTESASVTVTEGAAAVATKVPVLTVAAKAVTMSKLGKIVSATAGTWPAVPASVSYQWQRAASLTPTAWVDMPGQTVATIELALANPDFNVGDRYRVVVTAFRTGYLPGTTTSGAVVVIP